MLLFAERGRGNDVADPAVARLDLITGRFLQAVLAAHTRTSVCRLPRDLGHVSLDSTATTPGVS